MKQMFSTGGGVSQTKRYIIPVIFVILLLIITVGLSYAMYTFTGSGTKENVIQTGHIVITFNDVNNISIQNRYPETDSEGLANTDTNSQMTFTVTSDITGDTKVNYALGITDIQEGATLTQDYIKIYLKKGNNVVAGFTENKGELISSFKPLYIENVMTSHVLLTDVISGNEVHTYTLKAWIDENYKLPIIARSEKYEVVSVSACAAFFVNAASVSTDVATAFCNGTGYLDGETLEILDMVEDSNEMLQYMLTNNIIKKRTGTNVEHVADTNSETFAFKIKGYGTTESIEVIDKSLKGLILGKNNSNVIGVLPEASLKTTYKEAGDKFGLYVSTDTNDGRPTYYFRGNNGCQGVTMTQEICTLLGGTTFVSYNSSCKNGTTYYFTNQLTKEQCLANGGTYDENAVNNYVSFAGLMWRIVRINENGSIRLLLNDGINNNKKYQFNPSSNNYTYMYYSNSDVEGGIKRTLDTWYNDNLKTYEDYIVDTEFCEQFKVASGSENVTAESVTAPTYDNYTSNFKCSTDGNGKGIITSKVGLLTYDEAVHAGNYPVKSSASYITNGYGYWLMNPSGFYYSYAVAWDVDVAGGIYNDSVNTSRVVFPVISLKAGLLATGTGTTDDPYVVETR